MRWAWLPMWMAWHWCVWGLNPHCFSFQKRLHGGFSLSPLLNARWGGHPADLKSGSAASLNGLGAGGSPLSYASSPGVGMCAFGGGFGDAFFPFPGLPSQLCPGQSFGPAWATPAALPCPEVGTKLEELQWEEGRGHQGALHWRCPPPMELLCQPELFSSRFSGSLPGPPWSPLTS